VAIAVIFGVITLRLIDVQAASRSHYVQLGLDQRVQHVTVTPERGSIFDRNGSDLAVSVQLQTVWADPHVIKHPIEYAAKLAPIVNVAEPDLRARLSQSKLEFVYVARQVEPSVVAQIRALALPGIGFSPESKRFYPAGTLAAPVLGFVGLDNNGLGGLEVGDEKQLAGRPGTEIVERDPQGIALPGTTRSSTRPSARSSTKSTRPTRTAASRSPRTCAPATSSRWPASTARPIPCPRPRRHPRCRASPRFPRPRPSTTDR
jgi:cell division protein FtsI (penicillin-binding protein 3)